MGLFNRFRRPADVDQSIRNQLVELVLAVMRDQDGRIRIEDAISAAATIVGERCIDTAGDFPLRAHELAPGSHAFSTRANELICGDVSEGGVSQTPADSIVGVLRARLDSLLYPDVEFPNLSEVFKQFAARIGDPTDWGKVPLSVAEDHLPFIQPLRVGYETRVRVDAILEPVRDDKARCLRIATEALAEILTMVASTIDHKLALTIAVETINGMAKTAPMTGQAMQQAKQNEGMSFIPTPATANYSRHPNIGPNIMTKIFKPACVILTVLLICLLPHATHTIGAYPENLWTSAGQFSNPSEIQALLEWNRTEYGVLWAWLVHDSCTSEPAWYVRIEPRYLVLYVGGALFAGLTVIFITGTKRCGRGR